ncbi:hypothetical protein CEP54_015195 [Fusarium duplospermum]|uniref:Uncharacterized protein n=1 Tax=Fusarium duplospermum TaxID=1325734 RepID=A0A428NQV0_9HYPO|nr:hypothetical protein CEP54_015195 [Fusarium duplospermum]
MKQEKEHDHDHDHDHEKTTEEATAKSSLKQKGVTMCIVYRDQDFCKKCDYLIYSREAETLCGSGKSGCNKHLLVSTLKVDESHCPKCEEEKKKKEKEKKEKEDKSE